MVNKNSIRYIVRNADYIFRKLRWQDNVICPHCGHTHVYECASSYKCAKCRKTFTPFTNTLMHGTHLDASAWILILYLMLDSRGISSVEVARKVGITQKSAWTAMMKWRLAMSQDSVELNGTVSMDEAYMKGSWSNKPLKTKYRILEQYIPTPYRKGSLNKKSFQKINNDIHTPIVGMNDGTNVVLKVLPKGFNKTDIQDIFNQHSHNVDMCVADSSKLYDDWSVPFTRMNHSKGQYSVNGYSSNNVEGLFSHLKRAMRHNQVHVSDKYLQLYLDEVSFRWRHRLDNIHVKLANTFLSVTTQKSILDDSSYARKDSSTDLYKVTEMFKSCSLIASIELNGITYYNPF